MPKVPKLQLRQNEFLKMYAINILKDSINLYTF